MKCGERCSPHWPGVSMSIERMGWLSSAAIQYVPPTGDFWIDILARLGEAFRFADLESEELVVEGVRVRVATARTLYRMKKDTVRPQDRLDAQALRERFNLLEE